MREFESVGRAVRMPVGRSAKNRQTEILWRRVTGVQRRDTEIPPGSAMSAKVS